MDFSRTSTGRGILSGIKFFYTNNPSIRLIFSIKSKSKSRNTKVINIDNINSLSTSVFMCTEYSKLASNRWVNIG